MDAAALEPAGYDGAYKFVGNRLCLDFVNTISWPDHAMRHDWLHDSANLVNWSRLANLVDDRTTTDVLAVLADDGARAERVLAAVHRQRAVLNEAIRPLAAGALPSTTQVAAVNELLISALSRRRLTGRPPTWSWAPVTEPEHLTAPVIHDAAELLATSDHSRIGQCPSCAWLYFDTTRNRSRRWCDMADCGSRDKARSYYHRHRWIE